MDRNLPVSVPVSDCGTFRSFRLRPPTQNARHCQTLPDVDGECEPTVHLEHLKTAISVILQTEPSNKSGKVFAAVPFVPI